MKLLPLFAFVFVLISTLTACSSTNSQSEITNLAQDSTQNNSLQLDWDSFKMAARKKDQSQLKALSTERITDFEGLVFLLSELYVMRKMDETDFGKLEMVVIDNKTYRQFYAEYIEIDEFGYEYATSLTLYFIEVDGHLLLDNYLAAG